jgi:hypothetical protein
VKSGIEIERNVESISVKCRHERNLFNERAKVPAMKQRMKAAWQESGESSGCIEKWASAA